jgi:F-box/leucine-rich repeat protein 16
VCKLWRDIVYEQSRIWTQLTVRVDFSHFRRSADAQQRNHLLRSLAARSFDSVLIHAALDEELLELPSAFGSFATLRSLSLHCCGCSDATLQQLLSACGARLHQLELVSCNELSDGGHWLAACPQLRVLSIADCINVADETIAAIGQTLPRLIELSVQAYHVTDQCFQYLRVNASNAGAVATATDTKTSKGSARNAIKGGTSAAAKTAVVPVVRRRSNSSGNGTGSEEDEWPEAVGSTALRVLQLNNCWELSNQAVLQVAHCLPHLRHLSLAGCSKITDEAVELIAEQMRHLRHLDLSWCSRISDAALEYIACDLGECLTELLLDRCTAVTDIGLGYVASMRRLEVLSIRWCVQVRDLGVQALSSMPQLRVLSLAGCSLLTPNAFRCLQQLGSLQQLELTNCPAANDHLLAYLRQQLPADCVIVK